jgi:hypothetical protein
VNGHLQPGISTNRNLLGDKEMENAFLVGCLIAALALLVWLFFKYR